MKNIKILKTGIDVSKIRKQLEKYPEDWGSQKKLENVKLKDPHEYITSVDVLQLVMGGITTCLLYTSPSPRDGIGSRMPSSA